MGHIKDKLLILWTNGQKETALHMVFLYAKNSLTHGWWEEVTLLVWGSASKLVSQDTEIQDSIRGLQEAGVNTIACKKCAENLNIVADLEKLQIDVFYTGTLLTEWLKSDQAVLSI